jgi:hypothetical protein
VQLLLAKSAVTVAEYTFGWFPGRDAAVVVAPHIVPDAATHVVLDMGTYGAESWPAESLEILSCDTEHQGWLGRRTV